MTTQRMMREASIPRLLLQMSLPVILVMLVNVLYNMADVFFMGRTGETMSGTIANILLDPLFISVLHWGIAGAAAATVMGNILMSFSSTFANRLLVLYGNEAVAAQGVAGKAAVLGLAFLILRNRFVSAFLNDDAVIAYGQRMVLGGIISAPFYGVYQMCAVYLQGTGKVSYATFTALLQKGIVYLPALFLLHRLFGLTGLIFAPAVTDLIATAVALALCLNWAANPRRMSAMKPRSVSA